MEIEKKRFVFYRDFWLSVLSWAVLASACVPLLQSVLKTGVPVMLPVLWIAGIAIAAFFWLRSYCEFRDEYLLVVTGPVLEKYFYREITGIKTTKGFVFAGAAPRARFALYVNRLLKRYVSPRDEEGFVRLFKEKCPGAQID